MKKVPLSEVKDDLSRYLRDAEAEEIVITRHGKPAGLLIGFGDEEDWFDYRLEHDPRFLRRIEVARDSLRRGEGVRIEELDRELSAPKTPGPRKTRRTVRKSPGQKPRRPSRKPRG